ncbi:MAG: ACT domain-containing protein, partial [Phycisphaerales bacterium]
QTEAGDTASISFTVEHQDLAEVKPAVQKSLDEIGCGEMSIEVGLAKVSAVGVGMRTHTGVAATMFSALGQAGIHINNITTSEIKISCIVPKEHGDRALQVVHDAFDLDQADRTTDASKSSRPVRKPL